jgi:hypothetical protein
VTTRAVLVIIALLSACHLEAKPAVPFDEPAFLSSARDSVFKVQVELVVDTTTIAPDVRQEIEIMLGHKLNRTFVRHIDGTAWVVSQTPDQGGGTDLMTAGHVCANWTTFDDETLGELPVTSVNYSIIRRSGTESINAVVVLSDHVTDTCLLHTVENAGPALPLSKFTPRYGEHVTYIGAPYSYWHGGIAPVFDGQYAGLGKLFEEDKIPLLSVTFSAGPGSSGSPVFYHGVVIGMIVEGITENWHLMEAVPGAAIVDFLERARLMRASQPKRRKL